MDKKFLDRKLLILRSQGLNITVENFIRLQFQSGARISDLLSITRESITTELVVIIRQSKGSNTLIIPIVENRTFWSEYRSGLHVNINCFSYSFFYKLYKRVGFTIFNGAGFNNSVTHSARKHYARNIYACTNEIKDAQAALGHKSAKSTQYYLNNLKPSNTLKYGIQGKVTGKVNNLKFRITKNGNSINII